MFNKKNKLLGRVQLDFLGSFFFGSQTGILAPKVPWIRHCVQRLWASKKNVTKNEKEKKKIVVA